MIIKGERKKLERKAAWILAETIQQICTSQSRVVLAVPGGRSVVGVLEALKDEPVDWEKVHIFMVDERLVPIDHPDSNFRLVSSCVNSFIHKSHLHPYLHDPRDGSMGLEHYRQLLLDYGGNFDIVLLGSGEDGHVAGLFPRHETIASEENYFITTDNAPKPPPARMSSSKRLIAGAKVAVLLFFGEEKEAAFLSYNSEEKDLIDCPAKIVKTVPEHFVLTDGRF